MADFLSAITHQHLIRILEEWHASEQNVNNLQAILGNSHSVVSQYLSILRAVKQRKEGIQVYYQVIQLESATGCFKDSLILKAFYRSHAPDTRLRMV